MSIPPPNSLRRQLLAEALELSRSLMKAENKLVLPFLNLSRPNWI